MRLALDHLDARAIDVDLSQGTGGAEQRLRVRTTSALHGIMEQGAARFALSDVGAEWVVLDASSLDFGTVKLSLTREATLGEVRASFLREGEHSRLDVRSHGLHAARLEITAGAVHVQGEARMQNTRLTLAGSEGRLEAEQARIEGFRLQIDTLVLSAEELTAEALVVGWGVDGFKLEAQKLTGPALELRVGPMVLSARGAALRELVVRGPNVSFADARVDAATFEMSFGGESKEPAPSAPRSEPGPRVFDYALLDGLSGKLHVDAVVDMTVPIIGNRRATHELRLEVDDGTIDFRELESNLSALEESILDFAVRGSALVLERGIPLLPTRGFGKPLLIWDLGDDDLALAQRRRVRLSVLPEVRLAKELVQERDERESSSSWTFALRRLGLENIALELALHEVKGPKTGAIKRLTVDQLKAHGGIQHELKGEPRAGAVHMEMDGLRTSVEGLELGSLSLDVPSMQLGKLRSATLSFVGLRPSHLTVAIDALTMQRTVLRER